MTNAQPLPQKYPFALYRGDTRVWQHQLFDDPPEWAASTAYVVGVVGSQTYLANSTVTFAGVSYTCKTAHTSGAAFDPTMWTADPLAVGAPIDITGWTFLAQYRVTTEDATVLATETIALTDPTHGIFTRTLSHAQSALITPPGPVAWDLQATKPDGTVKTYLFNDKVKLLGDVSRS